MSWKISAFADEAGPTIEDQIKALKRAGINHVDMRNVNGHNICDLPVDEAKVIKAKLDDAGISVCMFGSPIGKLDVADDAGIDRDKLNHLGKLSDILGCKDVRMFSYYNKQNLSRNDWRDQAIARVNRLISQASQLGLVLYHENERHIWGDTLEQVQTLVPMRGSNFKLIFDFDNYNQSGDDVWANWLALRDVTDAFHLKDSDKNNQHTPAGHGNGQIEKILTDAVSRGWSGPVSLEPHLSHSGAVSTTNPSGQANQAYKDLPPAECFDVAATIARELMVKIKAPIV